MRWLGLGRRAGAAPFIAIAIGVASGYYAFDEPLRAAAVKQARDRARAAAGGDRGDRDATATADEKRRGRHERRKQRRREER